MPKKRKKEPHIEAIIIAGIAVSTFFVIFTLFLIRQQSLKPQVETYPYDEYSGELNSDTVATIGQNYIKSLASYNLAENSPVILSGTQSIGEGKWLAKFEVSQHNNFAEQIYNYTIEILDGRVVRHNMSVMGVDRKLLVSTPEPEQVVSGNILLVKGQFYPSSEGEILEDLQVDLLDQDSMRVWMSQDAVVKPEEKYTYLIKFMLPQYLAGDYVIRVGMGENQVFTPFIITKKQ